MNNRRSFLKKTMLISAAGLTGRSWVFAKSQKTKFKNVSIEDAWKLHKECLIIDGHNDTPVERMTERRGELQMKWMERNPAYQMDIPRMREGGQRYAGFMIFAAGRSTSPNSFHNIKELQRQFAVYPNDIRKILTSSDVIEADRSGKTGVVCSIEGGWGPLDGSLENLRKFYDMGLRLAGISHGEGGSDTKYLQGSVSINRMVSPRERSDEHKKSAGLTTFGLEVLKFSNEHNIITDLSHINDKAYFEVIEKSTTIPIISHTAVYSLCQQGRCLTDDQIKAIADKGGVIGITLVPQFVDNDPSKATLERFIDHICYVVDMVGIDYVGIGTDYDGGVPHPIIPEVSRLVELTQGLMERGFNDEEIKKIWGKNFLRVMKKVMG